MHIIFSLSQNRVPEIGHTGVGCIFSNTQIVQVINRFAFELVSVDLKTALINTSILNK